MLNYNLSSTTNLNNAKLSLLTLPFHLVTLKVIQWLWKNVSHFVALNNDEALQLSGTNFAWWQNSKLLKVSIKRHLLVARTQTPLILWKMGMKFLRKPLLSKFINYTALKVASGEKEPRPGAWTHSLHPNAELQPCKPPVWPRFFVPNRHI